MDMQEPSLADRCPPDPTSFNPNWDLNSPARIFVPSAPKQRAWERRGRPTTSRNKSRTIMKRYDLRKPNDEPARDLNPEISTVVPPQDPSAQPTPDGKVLKKLRTRKSVTGATPRKSHMRGVTARADRRASVLPHKPVGQPISRPLAAPEDRAEAVRGEENPTLTDVHLEAAASPSGSDVDIHAKESDEQTRTSERINHESDVGSADTSAELSTVQMITPQKQILNEASAEDIAAVTPWVQLAAHADEIFQNNEVDYEQEAEQEMDRLTHEQRLEKDQKALAAFESAIVDWDEHDQDASRQRLRETASARKGRRYTEFVDLMDRTYWPRERRRSMPSVLLHGPAPIQADVPARSESPQRGDAQQDLRANDESVVGTPTTDPDMVVKILQVTRSAAREPQERPNPCAGRGTFSKLKRRRTEGPLSAGLETDVTLKRRASTALEAVAPCDKAAATTTTRRYSRRQRADRRQTVLVTSAKTAPNARRASTALERLTKTTNAGHEQSPHVSTSPKDDVQADMGSVPDQLNVQVPLAETSPLQAFTNERGLENPAPECDPDRTIPQNGLTGSDNISSAVFTSDKLKRSREGSRRRTVAFAAEHKPVKTPRKRRASTALDAITQTEPSSAEKELQGAQHDGTVVSDAKTTPPQAVANKPPTGRKLRSSTRKIDRRLTGVPTAGNVQSSSGEARRASSALEALAVTSSNSEPTRRRMEPVHRPNEPDLSVDESGLGLPAPVAEQEAAKADRPASPALDLTETLTVEDDAWDGFEAGDDDLQNFSATNDDTPSARMPVPLVGGGDMSDPEAAVSERRVSKGSLDNSSSPAFQSLPNGTQQESLEVRDDGSVNVEVPHQPAREAPPSPSPLLPSPSPLEAIDLAENEATVTESREESSSLDMDAAEDTTTIKIQLNDEDTDMLKDFLSRSKASKAAKIAERAHIDSRRDSDIIKAALASPRPALEVIDGNSPSPRKTRSASLEPISSPTTAETQHIPVPAAELLSANTDGLGDEDELGSSEAVFGLENDTLDLTTLSGRRSGRASRPSRNTPSSISLRRQGGDGEPVALKKSEAQQLALLTRSNTRRNKGGSISARLMLMRLKGASAEESSPAVDEPDLNAKVRWNEQLVAFFDESKKERLVSLEDPTNELGAEANTSKPRAKRSKTLGATNGTPAKPRMKDLPASIAPLELAASAAAENSTMTSKSKAKSSSKADAASAEDVDTTPAETPAPASVEVAEKPAPRTTTSTAPAPATQLPKPTKKPRGIPTPAKRHPSTPSQPTPNAQKSATSATPASAPLQLSTSTKKALPTPATPYTGIAASGRATRKQVNAAADKENKTPDVILEAKTRSVAEPPRRSVLPRRGGAR